MVLRRSSLRFDMPLNMGATTDTLALTPWRAPRNGPPRSRIASSLQRYVGAMGRIDYIHDPDAPKANSVVPSVVAIVEDGSGHILMIHKTDNNLWALPGGGHEVGESITQTVVREVKEETGYDVDVETLTGTYTDPGHVMEYDDGEVRQQFSIAFRARLLSGEAKTGSESREVVWLSPQEIQELDVHPSMRMRLQHALERRNTPYIG